MVDLSKVQTLLAMVCPKDPSEILPEKNLVQDLELDSFGVMEMVLQFESEFKIEIPDRDLRLMNTVQDVLDYLGSKTAGTPAMSVKAV